MYIFCWYPPASLTDTLLKKTWFSECIKNNSVELLQKKLSIQTSSLAQATGAEVASGHLEPAGHGVHVTVPVPVV